MAEGFDKRNLYDIRADAENVEQELSTLLPRLADARRQYARSKTKENWAILEQVQRAAEILRDRMDELGAEMENSIDLPPKVLKNLLEQGQEAEPDRSQILRKSLTEEKVEITGLYEGRLSDAIDNIIQLLPQGWLEAEPVLKSPINDLIGGKTYLSLVRGLRVNSEFSQTHRLRQSITVAKDYLENSPEYDHFAGPTIITQMTKLGMQLKHLRGVGNVQDRLRMLWVGASADVDATIFELLVAAACVECGRNIEFIIATSEKSPDLRCHDPFPMVIECKRRRSLSDYEIKEEAVICALFERLEAEAIKKGLYGRFSLTLGTEAHAAPVEDIANRLISQRLTPHPEQEQEYQWGNVAFHSLPFRVDLPGITKSYSPNMLQALFGWDSDLPEWDGIICRVSTDGEVVVDSVKKPIALVWSNSSARAINKRAWSPVDLFGEAMKQIPPGEHGIIYLAYQEGCREEIADQRAEEYLKRIQEWEHSGDIRVPISYLVRLYPRALNHGNPDFIESNLKLCSSLYGEPSLFEKFPGTVFTQSPE